MYWLVPRGLVSLPPRDGTTYVSHQWRKCATDLPIGQPSGGIFSVDVLYSKTTLACAELI